MTCASEPRPSGCHGKAEGRDPFCPYCRALLGSDPYAPLSALVAVVGVLFVLVLCAVAL